MTLQEDRLRVQTQLGVNMVVEAGAGTGKTTLLVDRLCLCALVQQVPPEKMVSLTFTEKSAAEIKARFILKLQHLLNALEQGTEDRTLTLLRTHFNVPDAELLARTQQTLARVDRACVGTIHSFCAEILKTFPLDAHLSPNAQIDAGQKAAQLFDVRWNRFLDEQLGLHAPQKETWKNVLSAISLEQLKSFAQELARLKPVTYDYFAHKDLITRACQQKAARAQQFCQLYIKPGKKPRALEKALLWAQDSLQRTVCFLNQQPIPPAQGEEPALGTTSYKDWDPADIEEARALVQFARDLLPERQSLFLEAYHLLLPLAQEVAADCQQEGVLSFDDLIIKTRNLLRDNLQVRRQLKEKWSALFIDEFQDTDPIQGELLFFLAEENTFAAPAWQQVRLQPGKLFVVGDPKQSIYRFRGADITAYENFTRLILAQQGEQCFLRRNFRSKQEIITIANQICSRAMVQEPSFQPAYEPIFTPDNTVCQAVEWLFVNPDPSRTANADDYRQNQAEQMARWISANVGRLKLQNGRLLALKDIAVLVRANTSVHMYANALRRYGIAFQTEANKDFFRKQEINDFMLFLKAVADPEDPIALAGVLRSPVGGLTDEELFSLSGGGFTLTALKQHPYAKHVAQLIEKFHQLSARLPLGELIYQILEQTFLPEACAVAYDGEQTLAHVTQFIQWAMPYGQTETLLSFISQLELLLEKNPADLSIPIVQEAQDAVTLLTIHKSKGLEFPVVILADLTRKETTSAAAPAHLFSWQYQMYGLRAGKIGDANLVFLEEEQKKHSKCEEVRVLYVALTRAREKLLLVADAREDALKQALPFTQAGLFPTHNNKTLITPDKSLSVPVLAHPYLPPKDFIFKQRVLPSQRQTGLIYDWSAWAKQNQQQKSFYENLQRLAHTLAPSEQDTKSLFSEEQRQGAELGSLCHRALEILLSNTQPEVSAACARAAQQLGAQHRQAEALTVLIPFVHAPIFTQIRSCRILACEMPFTLALDDGNIQNGLMDVVLETLSGEIWVIDYKTDRVAPGKERALFEQKYRGQLTAYQAAARKIFPGKPVKCSAIFIRTFAAVEL